VRMPWRRRMELVKDILSGAHRHRQMIQQGVCPFIQVNRPLLLQRGNACK
jgi:hypothetical protein